MLFCYEFKETNIWPNPWYRENSNKKIETTSQKLILPRHVKDWRFYDKIRKLISDLGDPLFRIVCTYII